MQHQQRIWTAIRVWHHTKMEGNTSRIQFFNEQQLMGKLPGEPVQVVNDHRLDGVLPDQAAELVERWASQGRAADVILEHIRWRHAVAVLGRQLLAGSDLCGQGEATLRLILCADARIDAGDARRRSGGVGVVGHVCSPSRVVGVARLSGGMAPETSALARRTWRRHTIYHLVGSVRPKVYRRIGQRESSRCRAQRWRDARHVPRWRGRSGDRGCAVPVAGGTRVTLVACSMVWWQRSWVC